jgi:NAD(P)-dependent dehydrogenase (short-subunit alcohol dehydrogenase family)
MAVNLADRVVLITGAGGGLGRAYALLLAARGAHVAVNDLGPDGTGGGSGPAEQVAAEIRGAGGSAVAVEGSVSDPAAVRAMVDATVEHFGALHGVVNNAGILRDRTIGRMTPADYDAVLDVHLRGTFSVSQAAFAVFKAAGGGRFVHTTSAAGLFGNFGQANYAAAKMGIVGLARVLADEGAQYGITSNVIAPLAATRLTADLLGDLAAALDPAAVAPLVAYLLSDACTLNREILSVGGGRIARVFVGLTPGWSAPGELTPETIAEHVEDILATDGFVVPRTATDEIALLAAHLSDSATSGVRPVGGRPVRRPHRQGPPAPPHDVRPPHALDRAQPGPAS